MTEQTKTQPWKAAWPASDMGTTGKGSKEDQNGLTRYAKGQYCGKYGYTDKDEDKDMNEGTGLKKTPSGEN